MVSCRPKDMPWVELVKNIATINHGGFDLPFQMRLDCFGPQMQNRITALVDANGSSESAKKAVAVVEMFAVWREPRTDFSDMHLRCSDILHARQSELRRLLKEGKISGAEQRTLLDEAYEAFRVHFQACLRLCLCVCMCVCVCVRVCG